VEIALLILVIYFSLAGVAIGLVSGLVPGVHVNTMALMLLSIFPLLHSSIGGWLDRLGLQSGNLGLLVSVLIVSAAVTHSFLDFVPSIFLGAPDGASALSVLPGHRLLLAGRGMQAVRAAALGSLAGASASVLLSIPAWLIMGPPLGLYARLSPFLPFLLGAVLVALILSERGMSEIRASIDMRDGGHIVENMIVLGTPVPVDGHPVRISGRLCRDSLGRAWLETPSRRWRLLGCVGPSGFHTVAGIWRLRIITWRGKIWALVISLLAGALGYTVMNATLPFHQLSGLDQSPLFPLLTGLFGVPTMLLSLSPSRLPHQREGVEVSALPSLGGILAGALVGWFPGITSTAGAVIGTLSRRRGSEDPIASATSFIVTVSAVGTSATVFSLIALSVTGNGRTGAMLAVIEVMGGKLESLCSLSSSSLALMLLAVLLASIMGYALTIASGRVFLRLVTFFPVRRMNQVILMLILLLVSIFNGVPGFLLLMTCTCVGLLPPRLGIGRVHLTGCLLIPIILFFLH